MRLVQIVIAGLMVLIPPAAAAHETIENRIGWRSELVIRNDLRQLGIVVRSVTMHGRTARVEVEVGSRPAVLSIDRIDDRTEILSGGAILRAQLGKKLPQALVETGTRVPGPPIPIAPPR
jgi:hypothetical protein